MGAVDSWLREYSERYRHSVFMEVDFESSLKEIIKKSAEQTQEIQMELLTVMMLGANGELIVVNEDNEGNEAEQDAEEMKNYPALQKCIDATRAYLNSSNTQIQRAIKTFNMKQKIREQILEIVSVIPKNCTKKLPSELVKFYKELDGSERDLETIRELKSFEDVQNASQLNSLSREMDACDVPILAGNDDYRRIMGWGHLETGLTCRDEKLIGPMTKDKIDEYLNNSLMFLWSLDTKALPKSLTGEYEYTNEYTIYRTLLIKQLAELTDHAHPNFNPSLKRKILTFAKEKLYLEDPKRVFREIQHEGYITESLSVHNAGAEKGFKTHKDGIVDAIRVGLTYDVKNLTSKTLIQQEIKNALLMDSKKNLLGFNTDVPEALGVSPNSQYCGRVKTAIEDTEKLYNEISQNPILSHFGVPQIFIETVLEDVRLVNEKIETEEKKEENKQANGDQTSNTQNDTTQSASIQSSNQVKIKMEAEEEKQEDKQTNPGQTSSTQSSSTQGTHIQNNNKEEQKQETKYDWSDEEKRIFKDAKHSLSEFKGKMEEKLRKPPVSNFTQHTIFSNPKFRKPISSDEKAEGKKEPEKTKNSNVVPLTSSSSPLVSS